MGRKEARPGARIVLADGTELRGTAFGACRSSEGEVVFQTGMVGYPESLTDPSYRGQILVCTYPLLGNYGVPRPPADDPLAKGLESARIQVSGLCCQVLSDEYSHPTAARSLAEWLAEEGITGISGVDTRALTKRLRAHGTMAGKILVDGDTAGEIRDDEAFPDIAARNLVAEVSVQEPVLYGDDGPVVLLPDCGVKRSIIRSLVERGLRVKRLPWDHPLADEDGAGILVSNGPGDPTRAEATIANLRAALEQDRPIFGVCLGNQLVALAAGARTYKLKYGHRGHNQPCREVGSPRCYITSQNHGYAVDDEALPDGWEVWFENVNDQTNEGIRHVDRPFSTVQFHPEAAPGPRDTAFLFDRFRETLA